jgi:hypothetical protein
MKIRAGKNVYPTVTDSLRRPSPRPLPEYRERERKLGRSLALPVLRKRE